MNIETITARSTLFRSMRTWFDDHNYVEVSTPILSSHLIPEPTIANFATQYINEFSTSRELYLIPSPEVFMKQIIASLRVSIYQFSPCFRNSEQLGSHHNPEFTMLEYYSMETDDEGNIAITEDLIASTALEGTPDSLLPPFSKMSVAEACWNYAHFDIEKTQSIEALRKQAQSLDIFIPQERESWEETFNRIFLTIIEPQLPQDKPLVLYNYPYQITCLAKKVVGKPFRKRWELYAHGIELANCYDEETDEAIVSSYYHEQYAQLISKRATTGEVIPDIDLSFAKLFSQNFPQCSGVAMGMDRLLMLQLQRKTIGDLILFPFSAMLSDG